MTRGRATEHGLVRDIHATYYAERASGGGVKHHEKKPHEVPRAATHAAMSAMAARFDEFLQPCSNEHTDIDAPVLGFPHGEKDIRRG